MSESRPSRYRSLLPGPMRGGPPDPRPPRMDIPKRSVVKVACDACRHRKAKCDGRSPSCSTCMSAGRECRYAARPHELQATAIKRKHDELQERMVDHEKLYDTLRTRQPEEVEEILRRIQSGGDVKSVVEGIQGNLLLELTSFPEFTPQQLPAQSVPSHQAMPYRPLAGEPQAQLPLYTKNQATFHVPGDLKSRGKAFAVEAGRLLALEDTGPSLPVVQGLALMHIYEGALGSRVTALSYHSLMQARYLALRLDEIPRSAEVTIAGLRQRTEAHALSWIAWGFCIWDQKSMPGLCRRFAIGKPKRLKTWRDQATSPLYKRFSPGYWWYPYPVSAVPQNALKGEILNAECDLAEITEQILNFLAQLEEGWPPGCNTHRALELYTQLSRWRYTLSERLRVENAVLPSAILLHLNIELLIISLLRPFDGLTKNEFGPFDPVIMSYAHASNAMWIIWHFRALYTLRNEHCMIQAASTCAFRVLLGIKTGAIQLETLAKACRALIELGESFPTATEVIYSLDSIAKKQRLELPSYINEYLSSHGGGSIDMLSALNDNDI
ncbi:unnamed protein product [Fusarium langsethiae]|nr:unnamed protein product [Fusarium langsethiae]